MEYKKNGKNKTKTAKTYLKVGDDPYQTIEGGFVEVEGIGLLKSLATFDFLYFSFHIFEFLSFH